MFCHVMHNVFPRCSTKTAFLVKVLWSSISFEKALKFSASLQGGHGRDTVAHWDLVPYRSHHMLLELLLGVRHYARCRAMTWSLLSGSSFGRDTEADESEGPLLWEANISYSKITLKGITYMKTGRQTSGWLQRPWKEALICEVKWFSTSKPRPLHGERTVLSIMILGKRVSICKRMDLDPSTIQNELNIDQDLPVRAKTVKLLEMTQEARQQ